MMAVEMVNVALDRMIAAEPASANILYWSSGADREYVTLTPFGFRCLLEGLGRQWGAGWTRYRGLTVRDLGVAETVRR